MRETMNETPARLVGETDGPLAAQCCAVCGSTRVVTDEVEDEVKLYLAECLHCSHRWISVTAPAVSRSLQPAAASSTVARRPTLVGAAGGQTGFQPWPVSARGRESTIPDLRGTVPA